MGATGVHLTGNDRDCRYPPALRLRESGMVLPRLIKGPAMLTTIVSAVNALKQVVLHL
jgi:hypothetical protein